MARKSHKIKDVRYQNGLGMLRDGTLIAGAVINLMRKAEGRWKTF